MTHGHHHHHHHHGGGHHHHGHHHHHHGHHHHHHDSQQAPALPGFPVPYSYLPTTVGAPLLEHRPKPDCSDSDCDGGLYNCTLVACLILAVVCILVYMFA
ncbi:hypothetical protein ACQJBY_039760 [Aegilops geniculata]